MSFERISSPDDPERCQSVGAHGQCPFKRFPGSNHCARHGGQSLATQGLQKEGVRNYNLTKYRARVNEFADSAQIKSLREEIGIVRLMIEALLNRCQEDIDLIIQSDKISDLIMKAEKLVVSCHRMEERTGALLDKSTVIVLCDSIVKILSNHVEDSDTLDTISTEIAGIVINLGSIKDKTDESSHPNA